MRDTFAKILFEEALHNRDIVLVTGDLGFRLFDDFAQNIPNQFINAGLTEQSMMSLAAGIAATGKRVFVYSIANFSTFRCLEQIRNDVCYMNNSVVIVSVGAGYSYGALGYSHHAIEDFAVMRSLPNIDLISPCDPLETEAVTRIIAKSFAPTYLRLGKAGEPRLHENLPRLNAGKFVRMSKGDDGYIFFTGSIGVLAIEASRKLQSLNINVEVISVPFVSNLDEEFLQEIRTELPIVVLEEHSYRGGLGSIFLEKFNDLKKSVNLIRIAASQNNISTTGSQDYLRSENGISIKRIIQIFVD